MQHAPIVDMHSFHALLHATPAFSGTPGEDATRWLLRIDRIAVPLNCGDDAKLAVAMAKLEGGAYNYSESSVFATWGEFKTALTSRYAEDKHIIKQKLAKCKQTAGENVSDYVDRHRMLCIRAGLSDRDGEEVLNKFLKGLIPTLYDRVMVSCPTTYDQAVEKAVYFSKQLGKTGRGHLLHNDSEGTGSKPAPRAPFIPFNPPNRFSSPRYDSRGPHQGPNTGRQMPSSRVEAAGISDLTQDFGNKLKLNMRSTQYNPLYQPQYDTPPSDSHSPPRHHNVMTRSIFVPHPATLSMHEESQVDEYSSATMPSHVPYLTPMHVVGMRMTIRHPLTPHMYARTRIDIMPLVPHEHKTLSEPASHDDPPSHVPRNNDPIGPHNILLSNYKDHGLPQKKSPGSPSFPTRQQPDPIPIVSATCIIDASVHQGNLATPQLDLPTHRSMMPTHTGTTQINLPSHPADILPALPGFIRSPSIRSPSWALQVMDQEPEEELREAPAKVALMRPCAYAIKKSTSVLCFAPSATAERHDTSAPVIRGTAQALLSASTGTPSEQSVPIAPTLAKATHHDIQLWQSSTQSEHGVENEPEDRPQHLRHRESANHIHTVHTFKQRVTADSQFQALTPQDRRNLNDPRKRLCRLGRKLLLIFVMTALLASVLAFSAPPTTAFNDERFGREGDSLKGATVGLANVNFDLPSHAVPVVANISAGTTPGNGSTCIFPFRFYEPFPPYSAFMQACLISGRATSNGMVYRWTNFTSRTGGSNSRSATALEATTGTGTASSFSLMLNRLGNRIVTARRLQSRCEDLPPTPVLGLTYPSLPDFLPPIVWPPIHNTDYFQTEGQQLIQVKPIEKAPADNDPAFSAGPSSNVYPETPSPYNTQFDDFDLNLLLQPAPLQLQAFNNLYPYQQAPLPQYALDPYNGLHQTAPVLDLTYPTVPVLTAPVLDLTLPHQQSPAPCNHYGEDTWGACPLPATCTDRITSATRRRLTCVRFRGPSPPNVKVKQQKTAFNHFARRLQSRCVDITYVVIRMVPASLL